MGNYNPTDKLKNSKFSGNGARQKHDQMTTKIKYKANICSVYCAREKINS